MSPFLMARTPWLCSEHRTLVVTARLAVAASLLLVSVQTALAQYYDNYNRPVENFYYQYRDTAAAENDLANAKALRDKAREERENTGKSDVDARLRLVEEFTRAIERGVEEGVR